MSYHLLYLCTLHSLTPGEGCRPFSILVVLVTCLFSLKAEMEVAEAGRAGISLLEEVTALRH